MIHRRNGILPRQLLFRDQRAEVTDEGTHVAVSELEPSARKCVGKLIRMLVEAAGNFFVSRIEAQREIGSQHGGRMALRRIVRVRHRALAGAIFWLPLMRACRALGQLPFEAEQVIEKIVAPLGGCLCPGDFKTAADGVSAETFAKFVLPSKAL